MDIRSSLDGLKTLLGVTPAGSAPAARVQGQQAAEGGALTSDSARLSNAGSEVSLTAAEGTVRADKVAAIQASLEAGTYEVSASAVASKVIDAMLERGQ